MERKTGNCYGEKRNYQEDMSSWRLEECPPFSDSYIEWRFEKKCREYRNGVYILTEWRDRKKQFISYLNASVFDFQHYSRHDESHALNILEAIEMLLGQERIDLLSIGDLWLLLECAYSHDMGMSYTYTELKELWEKDDFRNYIHSCNEHDNNNYALVLYKEIDNLLHGKERFDDLEYYLEKNGELEINKSWPLQLERGLQAIVADYARREHAEKLLSTIGKLDEKKMPEVPIRLYKMMVNACVLHGKEFEDIFEDVHYCEKGFGNSSLHPQFAAAMLRIGDLLDLDNNRFNERAREHYGEFPDLSLLHYKKHKAIVHFAVKTSGIEVEACSEEESVCQTVAEWFGWLDSEVEKLICNWNKIVPDELKGCLLNTCESKIYLENEAGKSLFTAREDANFQIDKQKMIKLLMGENIYNSHIDFIREYLQNALDASKMRLWVDIKNDRLRYSDCFWGNNKQETLTPFDIGMTIYEQYAIEVFVDTDMERQKIILQFKDVGIGIEEECVKVISNVGGGWRRREKFKDDLETMPRWLRPTGGFGIGVQSAFMVSDQVEIVTKGLHEKDGRKLTLQNPKGDGKIVSEVAKGAEEGTTVKVELDYFYFNDVRSEIENISGKEMTDSTEDEAYKSKAILSHDYFPDMITLIKKR